MEKSFNVQVRGAGGPGPLRRLLDRPFCPEAMPTAAHGMPRL